MQVWILSFSVNPKRSGKATPLLGLTVMAVFQLPLNKWEKTLKIKHKVKYFIVTLLNGTGLSFPENSTESDLLWQVHVQGVHLQVCRDSCPTAHLRQVFFQLAGGMWPQRSEIWTLEKMGEMLLLLSTWPCFCGTARRSSDTLPCPPYAAEKLRWILPVHGFIYKLRKLTNNDWVLRSISMTKKRFPQFSGATH